MARINRISITFCVLFFIILFLTFMVYVLK